jgi:hypothetical protein
MPLSREALDGLRCCVRPEYAGLAAEDLHSIIDASISGLPGDTGEDFLSTLGSIGKAVGPALQAAAPDVASGAATGSAFGPWGTLIGAGAGLTSSLIKSQTKTAPRPAAPAATAPPRAPAIAPAAQVPPAAPAVAATPAAAGAPTATPPSLPTGQGAAATLLSLFQNPTVQQAVLSQVLGSSGTQEVPTAAGQSIPRGAINALLSQLLTKASDGLPEAESISDQSYLQGADGAYLIDPASFDQQAALVLHYLRRKASARMQEPMEWISEGSPDIASEEWPEFDQISEAVTFY